MNIHRLHDAPVPWLGEALERFEISFRYPLGRDMRFRISHGRDYVPFFQAMGEAVVWVAEREGEVLGTLAASLRTLSLPLGEARRAAYLCDLKLAPGVRAGKTLALLASIARSDLTTLGIASAYAVVMEGTARNPSCYTGRLGIPAFTGHRSITIFKIETGVGGQIPDAVRRATADEVNAVFASLNRARVHAAGNRPSLRSLMTPVPLLETGGEACGMVEDTRRGKRLWLDNGDELLAAHLSRFAYASIGSGTALVRAALDVSATAGFPALFMAVPDEDAEAFAASMSDLGIHLAAARVYGHGFASTDAWSVDTSEI
jgi:hypothetical protein